MPCYCSTPDSKDQEEIERRAKERMYFDAQSLLTQEQIVEGGKRGLKQFPMGDVNDHLCKLCKVLSDEQMKEISAYQWQIEWSHKTLYDWHLQHCIDDKK
jgi:Cdc6-like AAA superfamily ATPase